MKTATNLRGHQFAAPWSAALIVMTIFGSLVLLGVSFLVGYLEPPREVTIRWLVAIPCLLLPLWFALFAIRGYQIEARELRVNRPLWSTRIPLEDLRETAVDPEAMRRALRLFGNGGLFAFTGWFRNRRLGTFRAFATDPARAVVLTFPHRRIVVTPRDPAAFVQALESRHG
jgi:hypothetical protein